MAGHSAITIRKREHICRRHGWKCFKTCCLLTVLLHKVSVSYEPLPPSVTQRCSMWWLASCPPTLLPASPAVFSITMRSCGVVNLPTMTLLSPFPSVLSPSLSLHFLIPLVFISSPRRHLQQAICNFSPAVRLTLFTLLDAIFIFHSSQSFSASRRQLTQLFGALAVACQFSKFHQGIKVPFCSHSYSWRREYISGKYILFSKSVNSLRWENKSKSYFWLTCQGFLIVFPHGHKVLQTGVELVQNPLLANIHKQQDNSTVLTHTALHMMIRLIKSLKNIFHMPHRKPKPDLNETDCWSQQDRRTDRRIIPCRHFLSSCWPLQFETFFFSQLCPATMYVLPFPPLVHSPKL